ncbi:bone morphogenetic protein 2-like [Erythrolamprus reginae]|uniref:bone morphogenetic protein 2-like n=1 Tax=Erythrolamprus reginae TaxID=121349 RepID=UPI00396CE8D7
MRATAVPPSHFSPPQSDCSTLEEGRCDVEIKAIQNGRVQLVGPCPFGWGAIKEAWAGPEQLVLLRNPEAPEMMKLLSLLLLLLTWAPALPAKPTWGSEDTRDQALKQLLEVFGIAEPPQIPREAKEPPQYMVDLYNTVADADGVTKDPHLLEGNTVRSFLDRTHGDQMLLFLVSSVAKNEIVLSAELHLFKLRARGGEGATLQRQHYCQVSIYQVLDKDHPEAPQGRKLLSARLLALQGFGWEVFSITQAVRDWVSEESSNQGLLVTVQGLGGAALDPHAVQFASGRDHHTSKKPMLVLFTDDGRRAPALPSGGFPDDKIRGLLSAPEPPSNRSRSPRWAESPLPCQRYPLPVDFDEIGWTGWVISPRGYNAYHCKGTCRFPLGQSMRPTNHATVQSIMHALKLSPEVQPPCCVPDKLFSINLLYFDDDETVVLKQYDGMVADSCGCH